MPDRLCKLRDGTLLSEKLVTTIVDNVDLLMTSESIDNHYAIYELWQKISNDKHNISEIKYKEILQNASLLQENGAFDPVIRSILEEALEYKKKLTLYFPALKFLEEESSLRSQRLAQLKLNKQSKIKPPDLDPVVEGKEPEEKDSDVEPLLGDDSQ
jgi:hypothetical protein